MTQEITVDELRDLIDELSDEEFIIEVLLNEENDDAEAVV